MKKAWKRRIIQIHNLNNYNLQINKKIELNSKIKLINREKEHLIIPNNKLKIIIILKFNKLKVETNKLKK
jgi:hypothetical protein